MLGLVVGKPLGIVAATALGAPPAARAAARTGVRLVHMLAAGAAAGIGFTVSLFVADLSYRGIALDDAKVAILAASVVSGAVGLALAPAHDPTSGRAGAVIRAPGAGPAA